MGSGAWKDVYKARQKSTQQWVALKHLREKNEAECAAIVREVRTQAQLTHQNIPAVMLLDVMENGEAVVVEKLVDGGRWSDTIATRTLDDNLRVLLEVSHAVAYAHRRHHIIHRDLKPDNVVINDEFGEVYVIDWGLAADVSDKPSGRADYAPHVSEIAGIGGTPLYWAPEMASGNSHQCSPASDVFLLGALLYEILTLQAPYTVCTQQIAPQLKTRFVELGAMLRSLRAIVCPPHILAPTRFIPDELETISLKAMSLEQSDRYADAGEFADAIKRYQRRAEATLWCAETWKQFETLRAELRTRGADNKSLHSYTLRLIEMSDMFRRVTEELRETHDEWDAILEQLRQASHETPRLALYSALEGELTARQSHWETADAARDSLDESVIANHFSEAKRAYEESLALREKMLQFSDVLDYYAGAAQTRLALAKLEVSLKRSDDAITQLDKAAKLMEHLKEHDPKKYGIDERARHGTILMEKGYALETLKQSVAAIDTVQQAMDIFSAICKTAPDNYLYQVNLNETSDLLFQLRMDAADLDAAATLTTQRVDELREQIKLFPSIREYQLYWVYWLGYRVEVLCQKQELETARLLVNDAKTLFKTLPPPQPDDAKGLEQFAAIEETLSLLERQLTPQSTPPE